jgi:hypothetical protein
MGAGEGPAPNRRSLSLVEFAHLPITAAPWLESLSDVSEARVSNADKARDSSTNILEARSVGPNFLFDLPDNGNRPVPGEKV